MELVILGAAIAGLMHFLRRRRRSSTPDTVGQVGDDRTSVPSRLRDPATGRVERGWL